MFDPLIRIREAWKTWLGRKTSRPSQELKPSAHADHDLVLRVTQRRSWPSAHQWRLLWRILDLREQRILAASALVFVLGIGLGIRELVRPHLNPIPAAGGTLTEGLVGVPKLINPLFVPLNDVDHDLSALIYSGLFRLDAQTGVQPDLAQSFQWLNGGKTLQVTLRSDARFHDNQPLTADDVMFTYQAAKDPNWHSPLAAAFRGVGLVQVDDHTVQFQLAKPDPNLLPELTLGILPAHIWADVSDTNAELADANLKPIGSGPYQFSSFTRDSKGTILSYHLERFDGYYGLKPWIQAWDFRFFSDQASAEDAVRGHQIDALAFVPWNQAASLKKAGMNVLTCELPQETVAFFNVKDPILKDEHVRRALALAVDRTELEHLLGVPTRTVDGPFPFLTSSATGTASDVEAARLELTQAGWTLIDGDPVRHFSAPPPAAPATRRQRRASPAIAARASTSTPALNLTINVPQQADLLSVADYLKRRWSLLGIQVDIQAQQPALLLRQATQNRTYQVLIWNVLLSANQDLTPFWQSASASHQGYNFSNLQDPAVDSALDGLANATSSNSLTQARRVLSDAITAHTPALFLLRPLSTYVVSNRIQGTSDERIAIPSDRLLQTMGWYISTQWRWK